MGAKKHKRLTIVDDRFGRNTND